MAAKRPRVANPDPEVQRLGLAVYAEKEIYRRTLRFVTSVAAQGALPGRVLVGGQTIGEGYVYEFADGACSEKDVLAVGNALTALVAQDLAIERVELSYASACEYFTSNGLVHSLALVKSRVQSPVAVYQCGANYRLALHELLPRTSYLSGALPRFLDLTPHAPGFLVRFAADAAAHPSSSLMSAMADHKAWGASLGVSSLGQLNALKGALQPPMPRHSFFSGVVAHRLSLSRRLSLPPTGSSQAWGAS